MRLKEMLAEVEVTRGTPAPGLVPGRVICDSREIRPGDLFVAIRGERFDGLRFLEDVAGALASMVVVGPGRFEEASRRIEVLELETPPGVVEVTDERRALSLMARIAEGRPDLELEVTGITGTNGKTTTAWILAAIFKAADVPCGLMGTVEYRFGEMCQEARRTTPEAPEIHRWLRKMVEAGAGACAMEVSSHALDLQRVAGIRFRAALFTNLTQDHLDYHGDMEGYYAAKRRLFRDLGPGVPAVINADDSWGRRLAGETGGEPVLYGTGEEAAFRMTGCRAGVDGTSLTIRERGEGPEHEMSSALVGRHNAFNVLAAAAAARSQGVPWDAVRAGVASADRVPGRLERVEAGQPFTVVVDYAHTDDALRSVLEALRPLTRGRLLAVFGCGGDRDVTKRPLMGSHAAEIADLFWVTSDNPRGEEPGAIIEMVLDGVRRHKDGMTRCRVEPDRARAIAAAVAEAREGDTVLIAGKGHERRQESRGRSIPFDDTHVARKAIETSLWTQRKDGGGEPA